MSKFKRITKIVGYLAAIFSGLYGGIDLSLIIYRYFESIDYAGLGGAICLFFIINFLYKFLPMIAYGVDGALKKENELTQGKLKILKKVN